MKISEAKMGMGQGPGDTKLLIVVSQTYSVFLTARMYDKMHGVLATREAHLRLGVQHFYTASET